MRKQTLSTVLVVLLSVSALQEIHACTTFCIHNSNTLVMGKNLDFYTGVGHLIVNRKNVRKQSFPLPPEKQLEWISKYGSLTFNQVGKEFPYGGMNEKGLVIESMWLADTEYPEIDERYGVTEVQWIQYQLDNSATVEEVLASDSRIRMSKLSKAPIHIMVCDRNGNKATLEYIGGKLVSHTGASLPLCTLANDTYDESTSYMKALDKKGQLQKKSFTAGSLDRFVEAGLMVQQYNGSDAIGYAFDILDNVSQPGGSTRWSIVYDIGNLTVHYKTQRNKATRTVRLADLDFSCDADAVFADIDQDMKSGKVSMQPWSYEANMDVINKAYGQVDFLRALTRAEREEVARYPEKAGCGE